MVPTRATGGGWSCSSDRVVPFPDPRPLGSGSGITLLKLHNPWTGECARSKIGVCP
uniref:Uncharacterized protein n=1 Tax=Hyaloperonospora arabidopsidis (strain Emoy2) TaxID=559515 RepID=M4B5J8_HYAAE